MGRVVEADLHVPVPFLSRTVCTLAEAVPSQEVPVHLLGRGLVGNVLGRITKEQRNQLAELLMEFHDVLARSEIDLWESGVLGTASQPPGNGNGRFLCGDLPGLGDSPLYKRCR